MKNNHYSENYQPVKVEVGDRCALRFNRNIARDAPISSAIDSEVWLKADKSAVYSWYVLIKRFEAIKRRNRKDFAIFYRHGMTKYNERNLISGQHNTALSALGEEQARHLHNELPKKPDVIMSSGLRRATNTMLLSTSHKTRVDALVVIDERLNEINLGELQGRKRFELAEFRLGDIDYSPIGGETYRHAAFRVLSSIVDLFDQLSMLGNVQKTAVVFCHAGVLRIIASLMGGVDNPKEMLALHLSNTNAISLTATNLQLPEYWAEQRSEVV